MPIVSATAETLREPAAAARRARPVRARGARRCVARVRRARPRPRAGDRPPPRRLPDRARAGARPVGARPGPVGAAGRRPAVGAADGGRRARLGDARRPRARCRGGGGGAAWPRGQLRRLGRHSAIYGLGGLVSRVIAVLLLPLYTRYLTPSDYGKIETLVALTTVLGLVLRAGITSAFFRFYFDVEDDAGRLLVLRTSFWFTMGGGTLGLVLLLIFASPVSSLLFGTTSAANLVRAAGVALWAHRELRAADVALPRRGALGRVRLREPRERLHHDRRDPASRRRAGRGRARRHRRELQRDADRLPRAARLPPRAARPPVRPGTATRDEPLRPAARPVGALPLGHELQRPLLPREAGGRLRGRPLLRRRARRVGDGAAADGVPDGVARLRVLDQRRARGHAGRTRTSSPTSRS